MQRLFGGIVFLVGAFMLCTMPTGTEAVTKKVVNCSAGEGFDKAANLSCYTCLGRDMNNCDWGNVCCKGSCYKLVDEEHGLIAKGCSDALEEDGSMKRRSSAVKLYWAENEAIKDEAYYCSSEQFCNGAVTQHCSLINALAVLVLSVCVLLKIDQQ